jgi:hypothetical protein
VLVDFQCLPNGYNGSVESAYASSTDPNPTHDLTHAFLSRFSSVRDTHDLIPVDVQTRYSLINCRQSSLSVIADGTAEPETNIGDDPSRGQKLSHRPRESIGSPEDERNSTVLRTSKSSSWFRALRFHGDNDH